MKLKTGVAVAGIIGGLILVGIDASNGSLFDNTPNGKVGIAGVTTAAAFGLTMVK